MEQIYYTQCPMGYGLGASNGFQVKRISEEYPRTADFRYLGMRPYPGGGRVLAPRTLRYRRSEGIAEVACLSPRASEYETERGPWGRPGGHFAHGVRLNPEEQSRLHFWFAGLAGASAWIREDRQPSRLVGLEPPTLELSEADFPIPAAFSSALDWVAGLTEEFLASIFAALAEAVREGRSVYLIEAPEKLAERVALLTFAFPESLRADLTFSTFHDRPEELPGFRIHGTSPFVRPNRVVLLSQGRVVDFATRTCDPPIQPPAWASRLAGWFVTASAEDRAAWEGTNALSQTIPARWDEQELDALFAYHVETLRGPTRPRDPQGWSDLTNRADWVRGHRLGSAWSATIGPEWWDAGPVEPRDEARATLSAVLKIPEAWAGDLSEGWGRIVAGMLADADTDTRETAILSIVKSSPREVRAGFLRSVVSCLAKPAAESFLKRLQADDSVSSSFLLPLLVPNAVSAHLDEGRPEPLQQVLTQAIREAGALPPVLDAIAAEASKRGEATERIANDLNALFGKNAEALAWCLRRPKDGREWLGPCLRRQWLIPGKDREDWRALRDKTTTADRIPFTKIFLLESASRSVSADAFLWAVEELLLELPASSRPLDPNLPALYIDKMKSDLFLFDRIIRPKPENEPIRRWLESSPMPAPQAARLARLRRLFHALKSGQAANLVACELHEMTPADRPKLLGSLLAHAKDRPGDVLEKLKGDWPELVTPCHPTRSAFANRIAAWNEIAGRSDTASLWFDRVRWVIDRLGGDPREYGPDGLLAEILSATSMRLAAEGAKPPWGIRQWIFDQDATWKALAVDLRRELSQTTPEEAPRIVEEWDQRIVKPFKNGAFWEVVLNSCDGAQLAHVATVHCRKIRDCGKIPWWDGVGRGERIPEMREAFCALIPMAALPAGSLAGLRLWLDGSANALERFSPDAPLSAEPETGVRTGSSMSEARRRRLKCVETLTNFVGDKDLANNWARIIRGWALGDDPPPLASTSIDDRRDFLDVLLKSLPEITTTELQDVARQLIGIGYESSLLLREIRAQRFNRSRQTAQLMEEILQARQETARIAASKAAARVSAITARVKDLEEQIEKTAPSAQLTELQNQVHWAKTELADAVRAAGEAVERHQSACRWLSADQDGEMR